MLTHLDHSQPLRLSCLTDLSQVHHHITGLFLQVFNLAIHGQTLFLEENPAYFIAKFSCPHLHKL